MPKLTSKKVSLDELKGLYKAVGKTRYLPKAIKDKFRARGYTAYPGKPIFQKEAEDFISELKDEGRLKKISKARSVREMFRGIVKERLKQQAQAQATTGKQYYLGAKFLPDKIARQNFLRYLETIGGKKPYLRMKNILREQNMDHLENLTQGQMTRILEKLRAEGLVTTEAIGQKIAEKERLRQAYVKMGIEAEAGGRIRPSEKEDLPPGVLRAVGRSTEAETAIDRVVNPRPEAGEEIKSPAEIASPTSAAGEARKENSPKTSISRVGQTEKKEEELPDILVE